MGHGSRVMCIKDPTGGTMHASLKLKTQESGLEHFDANQFEREITTYNTTPSLCLSHTVWVDWGIWRSSQDKWHHHFMVFHLIPTIKWMKTLHDPNQITHSTSPTNGIFNDYNRYCYLRVWSSCMILTSRSTYGNILIHLHF